MEEENALLQGWNACITGGDGPGRGTHSQVCPHSRQEHRPPQETCDRRVRIEDDLNTQRPRVTKVLHNVMQQKVGRGGGISGNDKQAMEATCHDVRWNIDQAKTTIFAMYTGIRNTHAVALCPRMSRDNMAAIETKVTV